MSPKISAEHLQRKAIVYVRQSTMRQVAENLESQRRQYGLEEYAREPGFEGVEVIDEDLGRSGSGKVRRPGFQRLVAEVCSGAVGAVFCIEASRLARNGRDWHHLIDLCGLTGALLVDPEGIYDPRLSNDRLLLGMKGTMSEFELSLLRQRSVEAIRAKAHRGQLRFRLPVGLIWSEDERIELDPDRRVQEAIYLVFRKFLELGSARRILLWFRQEKVSLPRARYSRLNQEIEWKLPAYNNILSILQNPLYAGAYAFGKTENRTRAIDGRASTTRGHRKPRERWHVLLRDHHPGYISWEQFERNQKVLAENAHMKQRMSRSSGRGGRGLLAGRLRCGRCGRMLRVAYSGRTKVPRYYCRDAHINHGGIAVEGRAIEAALQALDRLAQQ